MVNESKNCFRVKDLLKKIYYEDCNISDLCELKLLQIETRITFCVEYNIWIECSLEDYNIKKNKCLDVFMKYLKDYSFQEQLDMITKISKFQVRKRKMSGKPENK